MFTRKDLTKKYKMGRGNLGNKEILGWLWQKKFTSIFKIRVGRDRDRAGSPGHPRTKIPNPVFKPGTDRDQHTPLEFEESLKFF